jgi:hypothetical protein
MGFRPTLPQVRRFVLIAAMLAPFFSEFDSKRISEPTPTHLLLDLVVVNHYVATY